MITNEQQEYEKLLTTTSHQKDAHQSHNLSPHTHHNGYCKNKMGGGDNEGLVVRETSKCCWNELFLIPGYY
jgi:hypothetical protein